MFTKAERLMEQSFRSFDFIFSLATKRYCASVGYDTLACWRIISNRLNLVSRQLSNVIASLIRITTCKQALYSTKLLKFGFANKKFL